MMLNDLESTLIGVSPDMAIVRQRIMQFAPTELPVLVQGPTGVGKELVAGAIHTVSKRAGTLVTVNTGAIPESMFEAEMFGYVKGAFSGASIEKAGFLAEASGGTLFLDEIGTMSLVVQPKLLRALDSRRFRPLGARLDRCSDFRIVAATNEVLEANVDAARFRADLLYRLRVAVIELPALERRREDIPILARHFASGDGAKERAVAITEEAIRYLACRSWPGNVRELRHVIRSAAAITTSGSITRADLLEVNVPLQTVRESRAGSERARNELLDALRQHDWHVGLTAAALGIHRVTLSRRMARLGIKLPRRDVPRKPPEAA